MLYFDGVTRDDITRSLAEIDSVKNDMYSIIRKESINIKMQKACK